MFSRWLSSNQNFRGNRWAVRSTGGRWNDLNDTSHSPPPSHSTTPRHTAAARGRCSSLVHYKCAVRSRPLDTPTHNFTPKRPPTSSPNHALSHFAGASRSPDVFYERTCFGCWGCRTRCRRHRDARKPAAYFGGQNVVCPVPPPGRQVMRHNGGGLFLLPEAARFTRTEYRPASRTP